MEFILILFVSIGAMSDKDSMAITHIPFKTLTECQTAGVQSKSVFDKGTKQVQFVCVSRKV